MNRNKLDVLFLIPHPFYQDRGSPIADEMVLRVLSERGNEVDVVTYSEGKDIRYDNITLYRTINLPWVNNVSPGFSWKKIIYDFLMLIEAIRLASKKKYNLVHAVEESVFMALLLKLLFQIPYLYDMDSSLAQQMVEKYPFLSRFKIVLNYLEKLAVKNAKAVIPVCKTLADDIAVYRPKKVAVLPDVSLLNSEKYKHQENLKSNLNISNLMLMYVGNLESYQGIDLLLESFYFALQETEQLDLVIVGGKSSDIKKNQEKANQLNIGKRVHFLGTKPVKSLKSYLSQADILLSPRTTGKNTPMKIYSYLDSGQPVLATDIPSHNQVLDRKVAMLCQPTPEEFSKGINSLVRDKDLRLKLGTEGRKLVQENHSYSAFRKQLNSLYDWVSSETFPPSDVVIGKSNYKSMP